MKKKTYLLIALSMVSMGMNAQNSEKSSLGNDVPEFVKTMKIGLLFLLLMVANTAAVLVLVGKESTL